MKKMFTLLLVVALMLSVCACGGNSGMTAEEYEAMIEERDQKIAEYESVLEEQKLELEELNRLLSEQEQKLEQHSDVMYRIENGDFDSVIIQMEQMKEEARLAEYKARGIEEIIITVDNWAEYFEYTPNSEVYIVNSFAEVEVINFTGGIRLKEEYTLAEDAGTKVNFEMDTKVEKRICVINFWDGSVEFGEVVSVSDQRETYTTSYSDWVWYYGGNGVSGYGSIHQANRDELKEGQILTKEMSFCVITEMLRAEGVLYIYGE